MNDPMNEVLCPYLYVYESPLGGGMENGVGGEGKKTRFNFKGTIVAQI